MTAMKDTPAAANTAIQATKRSWRALVTSLLLAIVGALSTVSVTANPPDPAASPTAPGTASNRANATANGPGTAAPAASARPWSLADLERKGRTAPPQWIHPVTATACTLIGKIPTREKPCCQGCTKIGSACKYGTCPTCVAGTLATCCKSSKQSTCGDCVCPAP